MLKRKLSREIKKHKIVVERKKFRSNVGRAYFLLRQIKIPVIKDLLSIHVILHEIGHIVLGHGVTRNTVLHTEELEAELYALRFLRKWNLHKIFPEDYNAIRFGAMRYVMTNMLYDIRKGVKIQHLNRRAVKFCKLSINPIKSTASLSKARKK